MDVDEHLDRIGAMWDEDPDQVHRSLRVAIAEHPLSGSLLDVLADLICYAERVANPTSENPHAVYTLEDAEKLYKQAFTLEPTNPAPCESLGYFYNVYRGDYASAETYFRKAILLGGGIDCYTGLARTLAEAGRKQEGLALLDSSDCSLVNETQCRALRDEIAEGRWDPN